MIDATVFTRAAQWREDKKGEEEPPPDRELKARTLDELKTLKDEQERAFDEMEQRIERTRRSVAAAGE
jgi:hypothetical protein